MWVTGIDSPIGISWQKYLPQFILICFSFVIFVWAKVTVVCYSFWFSFRMVSSHTTRSKKTSADKLSTVLPLKKTSKAKKKPVVNEEDVEETRASSPELSQSDLARKKVAALMAAGEVAETKRLKDLAILKAAAKDLEDCVLKETKSKETKETKSGSLRKPSLRASMSVRNALIHGLDLAHLSVETSFPIT